MSNGALLLSYNNPISSQHVRELITNITNSVDSQIYTTVNSPLIIRECLALGIVPVILSNLDEYPYKDARVYIFCKKESTTLQNYKQQVELAGGSCEIIDSF